MASFLSFIYFYRSVLLKGLRHLLRLLAWLTGRGGVGLLEL